jgi:ketosteroid isomerase-like protein
MTDTHPNAQTVMRAFLAFGEGDMDTLRALAADDMVFHVGGRNRVSGDYRGIDQVMDYMEQVSSDADIENRPHAILADDEHVVALMESTLAREGTSIEANAVFVFHVDDGKLSEAWLVPMDSYQIDEFWGR